MDKVIERRNERRVNGSERINLPMRELIGLSQTACSV